MRAQNQGIVKQFVYVATIVSQSGKGSNGKNIPEYRWMDDTHEHKGSEASSKDHFIFYIYPFLQDLGVS